MSRLLPLLAFAATLAACEEEPGATTAATPTAAAEAPVATTAATPTAAAEAPADLGARVFAERCASCHGPGGQGDGPAAAGLDPAPTDLTGPRPESRRGTPGGRRRVIEEGLPGTAMVAFKDVLSGEELEAVYGFVHQLRHGTDSAPGHGRGGGGGGRGKWGG